MTSSDLLAPTTTQTVPRLIALDWGTSSLRAYLLGDEGTVVDDITVPWGIMATPDGDFARALESVTGTWTNRWPGLPMIAAGMIGSAQGWQEIPYLGCPTGLDDLVAAVRAQPAVPGTSLKIVPGVALDGDIPDVMRGEETQVVGALALDSGLSQRSLLIMPGTHSKWVAVRDGRIVTFTTYLTGELFAVLSQHSILGRPAMAVAKESKPLVPAWTAFDRGVRTVRGNPGRPLSSLLFSTRTLVLSGRLTASESLDYLSGLLIGEELRSALSQTADGFACALIGESGLCQRYRRALDLFGVDHAQIIAGASPAGLWRIALQL
ncbi:2-dehydro-3-deoxygalactonokinase [Telmatospirillum sp.]|uniref:2-dehydro-3-deoxygalactonokinase n=1 Tax=Telmatospirillum sp. TaxID=2079197 RepID=UPI002850A4AF|nr:2-dehydro-3-deoxygalactonokinase [Telmatospirillum sp.]MDR3436573.1 2-dehydro-3-deoxygalactonokinase [Telmatospirillum sp.]